MSGLWNALPRSERAHYKHTLQHVTQPVAREVPIELKQRVLGGDFTAESTDAMCIVRVFVSSTFTDTKCERDLFIEDVYPYIKEYARKCGVEFNNSEMRWGIRAEASDTHQTSEICMQEIARCTNESASLSYVLILGDKYGFRPFPAAIDRAEFELLRAEVAGNPEACSSGFKLDPVYGNKDDAGVLDEWFRLDLNTGRYILQSAAQANKKDQDAGDGRKFNRWWGKDDDGIFPRIQMCLRRAATSLLDKEELAPARADAYHRSVTAEEIKVGLVDDPERAQRTFFYDRPIANVTEEMKQKNIHNFIDYDWQAGSYDQEARSKLLAVKGEVLGLLPADRVKQWPALEYAADTGIAADPHADYLAGICDHYTDLLIRSVAEAAQKAAVVPDQVFEEAARHNAFAKVQGSERSMGLYGPTGADRDTTHSASLGPLPEREGERERRVGRGQADARRGREGSRRGESARAVLPPTPAAR
jgi:hypothetical protein